MSAAAVLYGDGIDIVAVGANLTQNALLGLGEVHPDRHALEVCHGVDHTAGDGKGVQTQCFKLLQVGVDIGNAVGGELNFQCKLRFELFSG